MLARVKFRLFRNPSILLKEIEFKILQVTYFLLRNSNLVSHIKEVII